MASAKFQPSVKQTSGLEGIRSKQSSLCLGLPMPKDFPKWCCLSDHVAWKGSLERSELEKCSEGTHGEKLLSDAKTVGPRARPCSGPWAPSIDALVQATSWLMELRPDRLLSDARTCSGPWPPSIDALAPRFITFSPLLARLLRADLIHF